MPLEAQDVDVDARKAAGRRAAIDEKATQFKEYGQTSPELFPYTYWWTFGYNEAVRKQTTDESPRAKRAREMREEAHERIRVRAANKEADESRPGK